MFQKIIFLLFISFVLPTLIFSSTSLRFTEKEKQWLHTHPIIKVSNENDWPPFDFAVEGKAEGFSVDMVRLLAQKIGIKVHFIHDSWAELLKEFDNGRINMMHCMTKDKQRAAKYSFSQSYMPWRISYFVRNDDFGKISSKDFAGKRIAAGKGWSTTTRLKEIYPDAKIVEYDSSLAMLDALSTFKVDVAIDNIHVFNYLMSQNIVTNIKHGGYIKLKEKEKNNFHFVTHKNDEALISVFNKAYASLSTSEKLALQKKWFVNQSSEMITLSGKEHQYNMFNNLLPRINLTQKEKEYLKKKKIITMCIDPAWMPYEKFDDNGKHIGMTADFFAVFEKDIGIPIKVVHTNSWSQSLEAAKNRKCDILSLAMETPERKTYMSFTTPYLSIPLVLATRPDVGFFDDFRYIEDKKVGVVKGYAFNELIRKEYPNLQVVDVKNLEEGLNKVVNKELFGFIGTLASIGYMFQTKYVGELKIAGKFDEKWELGIGVRNDDPILLGIFEKAVQNIPPEVKHKIFSKFITIKYDQHMDYKLIIKILLVSLVIFLLIFYHNRKLTRINKELERLQEKLKEQAHRDPMTNLYNRRYFHDVASNIIKIAQREGQRVSIIMIDIDKFKSVNDTYGHAIGDEVIKKLATLIQENIRSSDIATRFGGEEFVLLLPSTDLAGVKNIASKIREIVESSNIKTSAGEIRFTISLGVSLLFPSDKGVEDMLHRADKALYIAKENGRNQIVVYTEKLDLD